MSLRAEVERAVEQCYDAVLLPVRWTSALDELSHALGGKGCNVLAHDPNGRTVAFMCSTEMGRWSELWERNRDWATDLCSRRGAPRVRAGARSMLQSDLFPDEEVQRSRFHHEIAGPAGCLHWASASFLAGDDAWCMPVFRDRPYARAETAQFAEVSYHLSRIMRLIRAVRDVQTENELAALQRFGRAAMQLDGKAKITHLNASAEALMSDNFMVRDGLLIVSGRQNQQRVDDLLRAVRTSSRHEFLNAPLAVVTRDGLPWLAIDTLPCGQIEGDRMNGARAILVIRDLTESGSASVEACRSIFGLTPAEGRLAVALCKGKSLADAAREFGVGAVTVRSHLRNIFAKTGTGRQAELVALLSRL